MPGSYFRNRALGPSNNEMKEGQPTQPTLRSTASSGKTGSNDFFTPSNMQSPATIMRRLHRLGTDLDQEVKRRHAARRAMRSAAGAFTAPKETSSTGSSNKKHEDTSSLPEVIPTATTMTGLTSPRPQTAPGQGNDIYAELLRENRRGQHHAAGRGKGGNKGKAVGKGDQKGGKGDQKGGKRDQKGENKGGVDKGGNKAANNKGEGAVKDLSAGMGKGSTSNGSKGGLQQVSRPKYAGKPSRDIDVNLREKYIEAHRKFWAMTPKERQTYSTAAWQRYQQIMQQNQPAAAGQNQKATVTESEKKEASKDGNTLRKLKAELGEAYMSDEEMMLFESLKTRYPWMDEVVTRDRTQGMPAPKDAQSMAEHLKNEVLEDPAFRRLMQLHGHSEEAIRKLQQDIPDYNEELSPEAMEWRRLDATVGSGFLKEVKAYEKAKKTLEEVDNLNPDVDDPRRRLQADYAHMLSGTRVERRNLMMSTSEDEIVAASSTSSSSSSMGISVDGLDQHQGEYSYNDVMEELGRPGLDWVKLRPGTPEYERRFLMPAGNVNQLRVLRDQDGSSGGLRYLTTSNASNGTASNATTTTTATVTCPAGTLDWSDSSKWPPNAKIDQVPSCALPSLSQQQLTDLGFFDQVHTTKVVSGNDAVSEAVSAFAASVAEKMPAKKVISYVVQTITAVNLFRDASSVYLPKDRYRETVTETYVTPNVLEVHVMIAVLPKRVQLDPGRAFEQRLCSGSQC
ncbi:unnamed protein product [Amoebophrya sp. A25]|nr:unnamed protein product [Amoebophrya sp. A25]|eukprot:GSA25T00023256001.1